MVEPSTGRAKTFHVKRATSAKLRNILFTNVDRKSILVTDESKLYRYTGKAYAKHQTVKHASGTYVNKQGFTTNNVENFFGVFKRGFRGTYSHCEEQHLQRYLNEFEFRYSNRLGLGVDDVERTAKALAAIASTVPSGRAPRATSEERA